VARCTRKRKANKKTASSLKVVCENVGVEQGSEKGHAASWGVAHLSAESVSRLW
jgi:hypothetical protein